ncbi:hypothetical protein SAMN04489712_108247 [Thermomonospora echinospora]|uniref:PE-PGRS family protein n=1 Tax=Thermomonospora echinospora TaxID=1992 RepID=A0A1H6C2B6_9ACTN|nr:DUF5954 family protein [Thermomonospora echinospora]SEG67023.1 hypothetical protein SAMN04489712_108247 [Thermomonospora echinospora]
MAFSLMPGYDHINVVADLDPVAAVRDREIGERMRAYPRICPAGSPDFGYAVQTGSRWRIGCAGACDPAGARYDLARHLRESAAGHTGDAGVARAMLAAAGRLDPEEGAQLPKDEWEIGDRRYRVVRIEQFTLLGDRVMEPPRPTDTDPPDGSGLLRDHPIDPQAPVGPWEAQLRLNLIGYMPVLGTDSETARAEARHAVRAHPGVILLPPTFTVVEIEEDSWKPLTGGAGPAQARAHLAGHFTEVLPRLRQFHGDPATPGELAEWARAAEQIEATAGHEFTALGRRFRTVRVSRMLRVGRDGPEGPRPSDQERYGLPGSA